MMSIKDQYMAGGWDLDRREADYRLHMAQREREMYEQNMRIQRMQHEMMKGPPPPIPPLKPDFLRNTKLLLIGN